MPLPRLIFSQSLYMYVVHRDINYLLYIMSLWWWYEYFYFFTTLLYIRYTWHEQISSENSISYIYLQQFVEVHWTLSVWFYLFSISLYNWNDMGILSELILLNHTVYIYIYLYRKLFFLYIHAYTTNAVSQAVGAKQQTVDLSRRGQQHTHTHIYNEIRC